MTGGTADGLTRHLFAFGSGTYPADPYLPDLPGVPDDLHRVGELLSGLGYRPILPELRDAPDAGQVLAGLEDWLQDPARTETDVLTVYYAGHGLRETHHRLTCRTSRQDRQTSTIRTSELAELLAGSPVGHALLILDTCYAELGAAGITKAAAELVDVRPPDADGLWLLASARARGIAHDHAFVDGLDRAVRNGAAGMRPRYLDVATLTARINAHLAEHRPDQRATYHAASGQAVPPFFPNREHRPGLPEHPVDVESAREWTAHFDPCGRGVEYASEKGDHFTGRRQALATLTGWLREPRHDARARVVTGDPGSGKSAVLGRLLALTREDRPEAPAHLLPPVGCVTVAVHAHGTTLEQLTSRLATALAVDADSPPELLAALADGDQIRTVLIDALDEAGTGVGGREPQRIARELLRPLSALPHLRLIIGTRRSGIADLGRAVEIIDLDTDAYTGREDIEVYAAGLLPEPVHREALARAVAGRAGRSFLVARMTVRALVHGDLAVDVDRPGWEADLPSEVGQAFDAYLARYGDDEPKVRRLLRPLAYAEGTGLPWDSLWAPLVTALSGVPCTDDDVDWLLRNAGAYILEVPLNEGRSVFRLYHEALADHLRDPRRAREDQRRMTAALLASVPSRSQGDPDWARAHPYLLAHLTGHADASGDLERLVEDAWFLVHADPDALLAAMPPGPVRAMYRTSAHLHRGASTADRAQVLAVDAARYGLEGHRAALSARLGWGVRWATGSQASPHFRGVLVSGHEVNPGLLASVRWDGRDVLLTAGNEGTVSVWEPRDRLLLATLEGHHGPLRAITGTEADGTTLVVTADSDDMVRVWDLAAAAERIRFQVATRVRGLACTRLVGRPVVVGCERGGPVWARDLLTGEVRQFMEHGRLPASSRLAMVCAGTGEETAVLVVTDGVFRWMPATGDMAEVRVEGLLEGVAPPVAAADIGGRVLFVVGDFVGFELWDIEAGERLTERTLALTHFRTLALAELGGSAVILVGCWNGTVGVWDPVGCRSLGLLNGHTASIVSMATLTIDGVAHVATGSEDGTVRLWDLEALDEPGPRKAHMGSAVSVSCAVIEGEPVAVTGSVDHTVRVWELASGRELVLLRGHHGTVTSVACATVDGTPVVLSASEDASVVVWNLATRTRQARFSPIQGALVACAVVDGRLLAVTGAYSEQAHTDECALWDVASGRYQGSIGTGLRFGGKVATAVWDGVPVAAVAHRLLAPNAVHLWDLARRERLREFPVDGPVGAVACGSDGYRHLVIAAVSGRTVCWDARTGRPLHAMSDGPSWASDIACGVFGGVDALAIAGTGGVWVRELTTGRLLHRIALPVPPRAVAFGPGGELVVCAGFEVIVLERSR
ncbi:caspase family protein [Streptomyces sp. NPDC048603]|uniref:caspase family protein n=1 Tax=Streptomyces sp. NPDC048603 TaxID=3365577 RepID=UPI00372040F6